MQQGCVSSCIQAGEAQSGTCSVGQGGRVVWRGAKMRARRGSTSARWTCGGRGGVDGSRAAGPGRAGTHLCMHKCMPHKPLSHFSILSSAAVPRLQSVHNVGTAQSLESLMNDGLCAETERIELCRNPYSIEKKHHTQHKIGAHTPERRSRSASAG